MAKKATAKKAPWKRSNPRKRAGRPYPNLVDNMKMAKASKKSAKKTVKKTAKKAAKKTAKKTAKKIAKKVARKTAQKATTKKIAKAKKAKKKDAAGKDPKGGLTAAGRKAFAKKDGSHLKPGVTKKASEMTLTEMRRKGSWAVRFYGRAKLPPLIDANGEPTRLALSAHAWGEKVPKTEKAARKIARKGEKLLKRYRKAKASA